MWAFEHSALGEVAYGSAKLPYQKWAHIKRIKVRHSIV